MDDKEREEVVDDLARIASRGPAAGFISNYASQRPDAKSVPTKLREIITIRCCTQVTDKTSSDMVLGLGKAAMGADASLLSEDHVGVTVLVTGPASFATVKNDMLTTAEFNAMCAKGRALRKAAGQLSGDAVTTPAGHLDLPDWAWQSRQVRQALRSRDIAAIFRHVQTFGISQARIATVTGMTQGRINEIINGRREVSRLDVYERIADGLALPGTSSASPPAARPAPAPRRSTWPRSPKSCASTPGRRPPPRRSSGRPAPPPRSTSSRCVASAWSD
jgi:predicted XRE-type DNA-binding protein